MRDYRKLRAFQLANDVVLKVYKETTGFPKTEQYGLVSQMRRAAISVPSNIVEGSCRSSQADFMRFLDIALGSAKELQYQISISIQLEYMDAKQGYSLEKACEEVSRTLIGLRKYLRQHS